MLKIRLSRGGAKKRPYYRIVVADSHSPRDGRFIERIGSYDPMLPRDHEKRLTIDTEKAKAWIAKGAQPSDRVARFLGQAGVIEYKYFPHAEEVGAEGKAQERAKAAEAAAAAE